MSQARLAKESNMITAVANIVTILSRLDKCRLIGPNRWQACCPAHEDRNPSLSISLGDEGKPLLYCHAGCSFEAIMSALSFTNTAIPKTAVSTNAQNGRERRIVATYDYLDEYGRLRFQKVRYEPKDFRIRRPQEESGWEWSLGDVQPVPYRLPDLLQSRRFVVVYLVEGEKDADRLASLGLIATCNFDGASKPGQKPKWRPDLYNQFFDGRVVYILPDNDEPGQAHAVYIANSLASLAQSVKVVTLPDLRPGEDVSDWLDKGHTKEELERACLLTNAWEPIGTHDSNSITPKETGEVRETAVKVENQIMSLQAISMADLLAKSFSPLIFLVHKLMALGHLVLLAGRPKSGKSWLVLQLAMCIDTGLPFLGQETRQAKVLLIALEDGDRRVYQRAQLLKWTPSKTARVAFNVANFDGPDGTPGPGLIQVEQAAANFDLIIIDTLIATLSGRANENDNVQMGVIINTLARIAHETNTAIVLVHHTGKAYSEDVFNTLRGASSIRGGYDVGLLLERNQGEKEAVLHAESRDVDVENMTLRQSANGIGWEYVGSSIEINKIRAGRKTLNAMLELDPEGNGLTVKEIAEHREVTEVAIYKQLNRLEADGYVTKLEQPSTEDGKQPDIFYVQERFR